MFSVKLVWEVCVAGELIPDQHAVPGINQSGWCWEPAGARRETAHTDLCSDD